MYNHTNQYRCTIIRGKSQKEVDNLLPAYASVIDDICPCGKDDFGIQFNNALARILHGKNADTGALKKTLDNHRTEIAGKLFGMFYLADNGVYYASERTKKFIADSDQPAFFKDICYKMQFPNGMSKIQTIRPHLDAHISLRQFPFVIKCLMLARDHNVQLSVDDIGYYILNALDVLDGSATPNEVIAQIVQDKKSGIVRKITVPGKASSYTMQHIREQLNYLELANLVYITDDRYVLLNHKEQPCLDLFASKCGVSPDFDVYGYNVEKQDDRDQLYLDWDFYYSKISTASDLFTTHISALVTPVQAPKPEKQQEKPTPGSTVELGDEGEQFVYEYEKKRVAAFNPRLVNKVLPLGKTKGLGYDIQSVIAEKGDMAEFVKYIEVKATKRVTAPDRNDSDWVDTINITRNEWIAAQQHHNFYSIYRVYFVRDGVVVYILNDIHKKEQDGIVTVVPTMYRVDFSNNAIDQAIGSKNV